MEIQALEGQTAPPTQFIRILRIDPRYVEIHMGFWIHLIIASIVWQLTLELIPARRDRRYGVESRRWYGIGEDEATIEVMKGPMSNRV